MSDGELVQGGLLECGCPWFFVPEYPDEGHVPAHTKDCDDPGVRREWFLVRVAEGSPWLVHSAKDAEMARTAGWEVVKVVEVRT